MLINFKSELYEGVDEIQVDNVSCFCSDSGFAVTVSPNDEHTAPKELLMYLLSRSKPIHSYDLIADDGSLVQITISWKYIKSVEI